MHHKASINTVPPEPEQNKKMPGKYVPLSIKVTFLTFVVYRVMVHYVYKSNFLIPSLILLLQAKYRSRLM